MKEVIKSLGDSPPGIFVWRESREIMSFIDGDKRFILVNDAFTRAFGYNQYDIDGRSIDSMIDDVASFEDMFHSIGKENRKDAEMVLRLRTKFGSMVPVKLRIVPWEHEGESKDKVLFFQALPIDALSLDMLPEGEKQKVIQLLVGSWILQNWKKVFMLFTGVAGLTNIDRLIQLFT